MRRSCPRMESWSPMWAPIPTSFGQLWTPGDGKFFGFQRLVVHGILHPRGHRGQTGAAAAARRGGRGRRGIPDEGGRNQHARRLKLPWSLWSSGDRFLSLIKVKQTRKEYHGMEWRFSAPAMLRAIPSSGQVVVAREEESFASLPARVGRERTRDHRSGLDPSEYDAII